MHGSLEGIHFHLSCILNGEFEPVEVLMSTEARLATSLTSMMLLVFTLLKTCKTLPRLVKLRLGIPA